MFFFLFFLIDKFVPSVHSLQEIATRANTNPEAKGKKNTYTRKRECELMNSKNKGKKYKEKEMQ